LSGGVDSIAVTDFLSKNHSLDCAFFHHGTDASEKAYQFVSVFCHERNLPLTVAFLSTNKPKELSTEEFWRNERYKFLDSFDSVITGHHLDDCIETYIFSSLHGTAKVIPRRRNNVLRPFLTTRKQAFIDWCTTKSINWCHDSSNDDTAYMRNYIRHTLLPHAMVINPGLHTTVKKIVQQQQNV